MTQFSFIQITDHHLGESEDVLVRGFSPAYALRRLLATIAAQHADQSDFIFSTGDLVEPATETAYSSLQRMLNLRVATHPPGPGKITLEGLVNYPVYFIPGNHDDRENYLRLLFPGNPITPLVTTAFVHKGVQFICPDWGAQAKAVMHPATLDFLAAALQSDLPTIIVSHHHLAPVGVRWLDEFLADDLDRFWQVVTAPGAREKILGILCAHVHLTYALEVQGIPVYGLRSTAFPFARSDEPLITLQPPQYRLVTVREGCLETQVFEVSL
jgi:3',5'-cyclic AMP phosphodiesterase CpdA